MKKILMLLALVPAIAQASTGYLTGQSVDGMYRVCYYDVMGSTAVITVRMSELCPLTYKF